MPSITTKQKIAVIGLGYVGLPLALAFSQNRPVIGFDINEKRVEQLQEGLDVTNEVTEEFLSNCENIQITSDQSELETCNVFIITVPTPVNNENDPDLQVLKEASKIVGSVLSDQSIVVVESTVYPGATEEICLPILEKASELKCLYHDDPKPTRGFYLGYSPERINPGDRTHTIADVVKVVSASSKGASNILKELYEEIVTAGIHTCPNIRTAEAAKVIENIQRDVNIALVNEFSMLFAELGLDTTEVLEAAETKWNFNSYRPGLVGGHCIGVDPYYLTYKARTVGFTPKMIIAGRETNESLPDHILKRVSKELKKSGDFIEGKKVLIMGATFKENCPDTRNSKVFGLIQLFENVGSEVQVYDPVCTEPLDQIFEQVDLPNNDYYDVIIIAVRHDHFLSMGLHKIKSFGKEHALVFDLKSVFSKTNDTIRL